MGLRVNVLSTTIAEAQYGRRTPDHILLHRNKSGAANLDISGKQLSQGTMRNLSRMSIVRLAPLRVMLAITFLIMSALQPGLFATADATGFHSDGGVNLRAEAPTPVAGTHDHGAEVHGMAMGGHDHAATALNGDVGGHDDGNKNSSEKSCEVHCAPAHAVLVDCPDITRVVSHCFVAVDPEASSGGEYTAHTRPPRHLN